MLRATFRALDEWVARENAAAAAQGLPQYRACAIRVFGQIALLEWGVELRLATTNDVDANANWEHAVQKKFEELLATHGKFLDPVGHEAWMPKETEYCAVYEGTYVTGAIAEPDFVLLSKALKAPAKNKSLLVEYLASGPSERFMALAKAYALDLEQFL